MNPSNNGGEGLVNTARILVFSLKHYNFFVSTPAFCLKNIFTKKISLIELSLTLPNVKSYDIEERL